MLHTVRKSVWVLNSAVCGLVLPTVVPDVGDEVLQTDEDDEYDDNEEERYGCEFDTSPQYLRREWHNPSVMFVEDHR